MLVSFIFASLSAASNALASPALHDTHDSHDHVQRGSLPQRWFQSEAHPVHSLFKRATDDGVDYPEVGSTDWAAPFPRSGVPDPALLPKAWTDALDAAVAAGLIPNIPLSSRPPGPLPADPRYPPGVNPSGPEVCSTTAKCRSADVLWDAPDGVFASSFDDGPYPSSGALVDFLTAHDVTTTHFMIGVNILAYPQDFLAAFEADNDIAVHTWSHPYMTSLTNLQILGELGWTMSLIHRSTGGRVPRYWRPPYGDSDTRVRAIAQEIFGMQTVIWNRDTNDWGLAGGQTTPQGMAAQIESWLSGSKSPGIMMLQHEITDASVAVFSNIFPMIQQHGWQYGSLASVVNDRRVYQNAAGSLSDDVELKPIINVDDDDDDASSASGSSSRSPSASTTGDVSGSDDGVGLTPTPTDSVDSRLSPTESSSAGSTPRLFSGAWQLWILSCALLASLMI